MRVPVVVEADLPVVLGAVQAPTPPAWARQRTGDQEALHLTGRHHIARPALAPDNSEILEKLGPCGEPGDPALRSSGIQRPT